VDWSASPCCRDGVGLPGRLRHPDHQFQPDRHADHRTTGRGVHFRREGEVIGIVNPTPGSLTVKKSHADIDVTCVKEGFVDAVGRVGSKFQAMTFGNILFAASSASPSTRSVAPPPSTRPTSPSD